MIFTIKKDLAVLFGNTLRQIIILNRSVLRPIAYNVNGHSTVVSAGDIVMEDMVEFSVLLNTPSYRLSSVTDSTATPQVFLAQAEFTQVLTLGDLLKGSKIRCTSNHNDMELLHVLKNSSNKPVEVEVFFALNTANRTAAENEFLLSSEIDHFEDFNLLSKTDITALSSDDNLSGKREVSKLSPSLVIMASHHSDVKSCTFKRTMGNFKSDEVNLDFRCETVSGVAEESVIKEGLEDLRRLFS